MATPLSRILNRKRYKTEQVNHDDINVLRSFVEYRKDGQLNYILYEMEVQDRNGGYVHIFKAVKLYRLIRIPSQLKLADNIMEMHKDILSGLWERGVNFITMIANVLEPEPIGLLFIYGCQGVGETLEEAKRQADYDYAGLTAAIQGTYRNMELRPPNVQEIEWLREKMHSMKHLQVVRGIPLARNSPGQKSHGMLGSSNMNSEAVETTEELIAGLSDREYVIMILATPIDPETMQGWLTATSREATRWESLKQGSKSLNFNLALPMMFMANLSASSGYNSGYSDGDSEGHGVSESISENFSESITETDGITLTHGVSRGTSVSEGVNQGISHTEGSSVSQGISEGITTGETAGNTFGTSENYSISHTDGRSASQSVGRTEGEGYSYNEGESVNSSYSRGINESVGQSQSHSSGTSVTNTVGSNSSHSVGRNTSTSFGQNVSNSHTRGTSSIKSSSISEGVTDSEGNGISVYANWNQSKSRSLTTTTTDSVSSNQSYSHSSGRSYSTSSGTNESWSTGSSRSQSHGVTSTDTFGTSHSRGTSEGWSQGQGSSKGQSWSTNVSNSMTSSSGISSSDGWSKGISSSESISRSSSVSQNLSQSSSLGRNVSDGFSAGVSKSISHSTTVSESVSKSHSVSRGQTWGQGRTQGVSDNWSNSVGRNSGFTGALTNGTSASTGMTASIGYAKSYQWIDVEVENITMLLQFQRERLMQSLNGQGAFFTDVYIATPDEETKAAAETVAKSAWYNPDALACPMQVLDLPPEVEKHLLYHFNAFSPCTEREGIKGQLESYKYSTVLLSQEVTAYSHPVRMSEGGVWADVENIPVLAVPSQRKGEIYMGRIISGERYTQRYGYLTPFEYRLESDEIMHGFFTGESRSGKTVAALRFISEIAMKVRRKSGKRLRIVCMDPKQDWRLLGKIVEPERFKFYSLGNPEFLPINLNVCKIPKNVYPQQYIDGLIEIYCRAYGLGERGKSVLRETIYDLYKEAGVFVPEWRKVAPERSAKVTLPKIYKRMMEYKLALEDPKQSGKGRVGNDVRDAYSRVLDRLAVFGMDFTIESRLFGQEDGMGIDDLIGKDDVVVLESYGLESTFKSFIFGLITSGFFKYAQAHPGGFLAEDQYETILVIEEANEVLLGQDSGDNNSSPLSGPSEFEKIVDQAAGLGLFIIAITQKIADMPASVIANSGLVFSGKISRAEDVTTVIRKIAREERYDNRDLAKWFPRSPIGWFVCRSSRNFDFKETEPSLVKVEMLNVSTPTDDELLLINEQRNIRLLQLQEQNKQN